MTKQTTTFTTRTIRWYTGDIDEIDSRTVVYVDRNPGGAGSDDVSMCYASDLEIDGALADMMPIDGREYYLETGRDGDNDDAIIVEAFVLVDAE